MKVNNSCILYITMADFIKHCGVHHNDTQPFTIRRLLEEFIFNIYMPLLNMRLVSMGVLLT